MLVDVPLTQAEETALAALAAAVPATVPDYIALVLREVLDDTHLPRPNLG